MTCVGHLCGLVPGREFHAQWASGKEKESEVQSAQDLGLEESLLSPGLSHVPGRSARPLSHKPSRELPLHV